MSKYIKVDDLQEYCDHQIAHEITPNEFQRMKHIEIIMCKDCKYNNPFGCDKHNVIVSDDYFCADGEQKET